MSLDTLYILEELLLERRRLGASDSYSAHLFARGLPKILDKLGEEVVELSVAARHRPQKDIVHEAADVLFHLMVLMVFMRISLDHVLPTRGRMSAFQLKEAMNEYANETLLFFTGIMETLANLVFFSTDYDGDHEKYRRISTACRQLFYCILLLCRYRQVTLNRILEELKDRMKGPRNRHIKVMH